MPVAYAVVKITSEQDFKMCLLLDMPLNSKIVNTQVENNTVYAIVEYDPRSPIVQHHFHVVPFGMPIFTDSHEFVGNFTFENVNLEGTIGKMVFIVIKIPSGEFGMYSADYKHFMGNKTPTEQTAPEPPKVDFTDDDFHKFLSDPDSGKDE